MKTSDLFNFDKTESIAPQNFSTDLDIYTEDRTGYDKDKIDNLEIDKIEFAYEHAMGSMQEIDKGMKIINTRTTLLLSYLSTLIALLAAFLFESHPIESEKPLEVLSLLLLMGFSAIIFRIAYLLLSPSLAEAIYNQPKNIMKQSMFQYNLEMMKVFEIELMQDRIEANRDRQCILAKCLRICILSTFIMPVVLAISVYLYFLFF